MRSDLKLDDVLPLKVFLRRYPNQITEAQFRWQYFHRHSNGLQDSGAVVKRNGRIHVIVPRFLDYLICRDRAA